MFVQSKATGGAFGWCRRCGYVWLPGREAGVTLTAEQQAEIERQRQAFEKEQQELAAKAMAEFTASHVWKTYHAQLDDAARALYAQRGIVDPYWLNYWELGYCPNRGVWVGDAYYESPSLTIPLHEPVTGTVLNIKHRIVHPRSKNDRYRSEVKGLPPRLFVADHDRPMAGACLLVEGEFKAMTTYLALDDVDMHVVGVPGVTPDLDLLAPIANCDPVYVCLDPDARVLSHAKAANTPLGRLVDVIGEKSRIINLNRKIDDMILDGSLTKGGLRALIKCAKRLEP